ncbi:hypothetical protein QMU85_002286 [Photobacterium damselae]|nr:hypothetical protein [Photobacterium damselae]
MHEFDSWVIKSEGKAVFRKIREKLEQRFGLGEILGMREGEKGETRFLGKKGKARADISFRQNLEKMLLTYF